MKLWGQVRLDALQVVHHVGLGEVGRFLLGLALVGHQGPKYQILYLWYSTIYTSASQLHFPTF